MRSPAVAKRLMIGTASCHCGPSMIRTTGSDSAATRASGIPSTYPRANCAEVTYTLKRGGSCCTLDSTGSATPFIGPRTCASGVITSWKARLYRPSAVVP